MKIRTLAATAAVLSLATAPAIAEVSLDRAPAPANKKSELGGSGLLIAILAGAAVIAGIVIAADGDDDPVSP